MAKHDKDGFLPVSGDALYIYESAEAGKYLTPADARSEYNRLRKNANRRLERLGASEYSNMSAYQNYSSGFPALPKDASDAAIYKELHDVAHFMGLKTSSISGARKAQAKAVAKMQSHGYDWINKNNIKEFGEYMREVKKNSGYHKYDSERAVEMFKAAKEKRISSQSLAKDFDFWMRHRGELEAAKRSTATIDAAEFAEARGIADKQPAPSRHGRKSRRKKADRSGNRRRR